jgi:hypothetical protein
MLPKTKHDRENVILCDISTDEPNTSLLPQIVSHDPLNADTAYGLYADLIAAVCGDGCGLGRLRGVVDSQRM